MKFEIFEFYMSVTSSKSPNNENGNSVVGEIFSMKIEDITLLNAPPTLKPRKYEWAYEAWLVQQTLHWIPQEVSMADDVRDWKHILTPEEKDLVTQILRFFTQADIEVNNCYMRHYTSIFKPVEISMMLCAFSNAETIHVAAYAHLLETVGMPDSEYQAFLEYKEMRDKYDYLHTFDTTSLHNIAKTMAVYGAFTEGLQLFASFAMLFNFQRFGKMKGMGNIIEWSIRDEDLHATSIIRLFRTFVEENSEIWTQKLQDEIIESCRTMVDLEIEFIKLAFALGSNVVQGITMEEMFDYVKFLADSRLNQLGINKRLYDIKKNPLEWMEDIVMSKNLGNFFDRKVTSYSKGFTKGSWNDDVFGDNHK